VPAFGSLDSPEDIYALDVLAGVLDGGRSARIERNIVRGQQVASGAGASYSPLDRMEETLFSIGGTPASDREIGELESALREEVERLKDGSIDTEELERVKTNVRANDVFQRDSMFYQAMRMGMLEMVGVDQGAYDAYQKGIQRVTAEDVHRVAREYLTDRRLTVAELVPEGVDGGSRPENGGEGPIGGEDAVAQ
jgi:zinc protease